MGFFFKKSKNFGLLKLNFSKSGVGLSFGVKGFRVSQNAKGTYINAGAKGFYYRKKINSSQTSKTEEKPIKNKETIILYQTPELEKFSNITTCCFIITVFLSVALLLFNHPLRSIIIFVAGVIFMIAYCSKNVSLFKDLIEQGKQINELKAQNYDVIIKPQSEDAESESAIQKRNNSKYREYKYSYENYKVNNDK